MKFGIKTVVLLFGVVAVSVLLTGAHRAAAADAPAPSPLQGYDSQHLRWLQHNHPSLYRQLQELPWVVDGLSQLEQDTIDWLLYVGVKDISILEALLPMPFLSTHDTTDVLALQSISWLAYKGTLAPLKEHAAFLDGISEDETILVAAAGTVYRDTYEVSHMLNPGYASIEAATSATGVQLSIIRTGSQPQNWTAGALADAVELAERTMLLDLPIDHVVLVLNEKALSSTAAGTNYGFAISYSPDYEQSQDTFEGRAFQLGLVHEVAHYYWIGNAGWIDEGLANTIEYLHGIDIGLSQGQLKTQREDCEAHDLQMLSTWSRPLSSVQAHCNYYLGTLLFQELRESVDGAEFSERLRALYNLSLVEQESDRPPGIAAVRQVFIDQANIVEKHWSGALNAPENRPFDEGVSRISHDLVQWGRYPTYDEETQEVSFGGTLLGDAILSSQTIRQARQGGYSNFTLSIADVHDVLGSILPPLDHGNWTLDPEDAVASGYQLDEGVFTVRFPFPTALSSPSDYVVIVWGFRDERRTPSIGDNIDVLGYARIRVASDVTTGSAVGDQYDANHNGVIDKAEVIAAFRDYVDGQITKAQIIETFRLYVAG